MTAGTLPTNEFAGLHGSSVLLYMCIRLFVYPDTPWLASNCCHYMLLPTHVKNDEEDTSLKASAHGLI